MEVVPIDQDCEAIIYEEWLSYTEQLSKEADWEEWVNSIGWGD